jgi:4-hydroxybenzoate polyprenyltransferase
VWWILFVIAAVCEALFWHYRGWAFLMGAFIVGFIFLYPIAKRFDETGKI